ncbi:MAG: hypothetical protein PHR22_01695 [Candidatus Omnitrophica bacterium]|nr:hypothetical protein [Candidatus Omnitrophota bacterium]
MKKVFILSLPVILSFGLAYAATYPLDSLPDLPKEELTKREADFGKRGKAGTFVLPPCRAGAYTDNEEGYAIKVMYDMIEKERTFCGAYITLLADLSQFKTMTFMIKGQTGGETFEMGLNDIIANRREDAVMVGSIYRYLPGGITTEWQEVKIPLADFFGPDLSKVYSLVFHFNEDGKGTFWLKDFNFHEELLVDRQADIEKKGYMLLDNFDHATIENLLGNKTNTYKNLPSVVRSWWDKDVHYGDTGRSLKLVYNKEATGWCGYYTLLNQIDGAYYDLSAYDSVSFMVKGGKGGEDFELGMADSNWLVIGDSLKAGQVTKYLPGGVTQEWQEATIPLKDFGSLDLSKMGSFVINFNKNGRGTVYIDDIKFNLAKQEKDE